MKNHVSRIIFVCCLMIVHMSIVGRASPDTMYTYAYLMITENQVILTRINLDDNGEQSSQVVLSIPADEQIATEAIVSPDGQWFVFLTALKSEDVRSARFVHLYNSTTNILQTIAAGFPVRATIKSQIYDNIVWSADSRYIGLNLSVDGVFDVYVYDTLEGTLTNVTRDASDQIGISWAYTAPQLATVTRNCSDTALCTEYIEIISIDTQSRQQSPDILGSGVYPIGFGCKPSWSMDDRAISIVTGCFDSYDVAREVNLWQIDDNTLFPVTALTQEAFEPGQFLYVHAEYATAWLDSSTLLIGVSYQTDPNEVSENRSFQYSLIDQQLEPLFNAFAEQWVINQSNGQVAARLVQSSSLVSGQRQNNFITGDTLVFSLTGNDEMRFSVSAQTNLALGCDLSWPPHGTTLAYVLRERDSCLGRVEGFAFYDTNTGVYREFIASEDEKGHIVIPVGWITNERVSR